MYIQELIWKKHRIEHIAQHEVEPEEVEDICRDEDQIAHREGKNRYRLYGQTTSGRYLFVVLERITQGVFEPVTARDMTPSEKKGFRKLQK